MTLEKVKASRPSRHSRKNANANVNHATDSGMMGSMSMLESGWTGSSLMGGAGDSEIATRSRVGLEHHQNSAQRPKSPLFSQLMQDGVRAQVGKPKLAKPPAGHAANRRASSLPDIFQHNLNMDGESTVQRVGKHHHARASRNLSSPAIAKLFDIAKANQIASAESGETPYSRYLERLSALRQVSQATDRPHTMFESTSPVAVGGNEFHLPAIESRPSTSSVIVAARPDQRTTELRLPQLKETTVKSLSKGAALQVIFSVRCFLFLFFVSTW